MTEAEYIAVNNKAKLELAELIVGDLYYEHGTDDWGKRAVILTMLESMRMKAERQFSLDNEPKPDRLLNKTEVQERLNLSSATLNRMLVKGQLPYKHVGKLVRFRESDIDAFVARKEVSND